MIEETKGIVPGEGVIGGRGEGAELVGDVVCAAEVELNEGTDVIGGQALFEGSRHDASLAEGGLGDNVLYSQHHSLQPLLSIHFLSRMADLSSKKSVRRPVRRAASSPIPTGPVGGEMGSTCGHMNCTGPTCQVRFCGPTTHIRDHHIVHAAHGVSQIWTAAIVAGLAIVLTGFVAFTQVDASEQKNAAVTMQGTDALNKRLDRMEAMLGKLMQQCGGQQGKMAPGMMDEKMGNGTSTNTDDNTACRLSCGSQFESCKQGSQDATQDGATFVQACKRTLEGCLKRCVGTK